MIDLDAFDKEIIAAFFVAALSGDTAIETIRKKLALNPEYIEERIQDLMEKGFIENNKKHLTELGRNALRVVLAGGVFDIIHPGHIHTLKAAKDLGNVLVVVVATDNTAQKMKNRIPLHNMELRKDLVRSLVMVDYAVVGYEGDIFKSVEMIKPDIIALGYDQVHQEKFIVDGCKKIGINVSIARLQSPIPDIKSSKIENDYGKSIYGI